MHKFLQKKSSILLIISILLIFVESFISIISSDFIQALTLRASYGNSFEKIDMSNQQAWNSFSFGVRSLYSLGTLNISLIFSAIVLFAFIVGSFGVIFSSKATSMYIANMRYQTYRKIQTFNFQDIDKFSTPSLITRTTTDAELVNVSFSFAIKFLPNGLFTLIYGLIKSIVDFGQYAITYAVLLPFLFVFLAVIIKMAMPYFKEIQKNTDAVNKSVRETILGIRVVKAYNLEESERNKFESANETLTKTSQKAFSIIGIMMPVIQVGVSVTIIAVLILGYSNSNDIPERIVDFVKITGFTAILMQVLFGFIITIVTFVQMSRAIPSIKRILEVVNYESTMKFNEASTNEIKQGEIEFKDVTFSFNSLHGETAVLKDVNLKIKSKERIGVIGATGSGKTTLINLIARLYDVTKGEVLIDGVNVKDFSFNQLNSQVSIAMQTATLFSGTIRSNIAMGLPTNLSEEELDKEIVEVAKVAEAWEFVSKKENGINSIVEQRGKNFSGGQKQRISIARTIAKKAKIVIFDDSTSALDTVTERKVQANIQKYNEATTIIVAQRISSVEELDKIIVLDKGHVVGFDSHWNLLKDNEIYRSIAASQLGTEELNEMLIAKGVSPIEKNND